ncbi:MAG: DUF4398 domain-containing protein [candidate division KSB1 bacterium]|nr:DUF4398 domain-containing protein [candidate division KSB1 bacterium]MDZ7275099.1 DUF4398 domain-containing protein [candidate division KSB1 bacterium]MDZ7286453.1 DUF4398 domain-containing protein [candidate division KSB1 bacterium]MDZ7299383.1 DUF4398 domain-containing protein [candidate division KSB1 bacterium]MDZ7306288.1 DUF4398 domain-containing protein [candidate division KSB1 bacterium]
MKAKTLLSSLGIVVLMFVVGCKEAPQQLLADADAAMQAAQTAEANRYATDLFNAAKDSLSAAQAEVEQQNSKFALLRNYDRATALLNSAIAAFKSASDAAAANKEKVRAEADTLIAQLTPKIEAAKKLMAKAPKGKEGRAALEMIQADITAVESGLSEAQNAMTSNDYLTARDKAQAAMSKINSVIQELENAIGKKMGSRS